MEYHPVSWCSLWKGDSCRNIGFELDLNKLDLSKSNRKLKFTRLKQESCTDASEGEGNELKVPRHLKV